MTEKPLHVRVAEALGWTQCRLESFAATDYGTGERVAGLPTWWGIAPDGRLGIVPRFDLDWSATGPLIERYGIDVLCNDEDGPAAWSAGGWPMRVPGETPLIAVCNLILALKAEGKLDAKLAEQAS